MDFWIVGIVDEANRAKIIPESVTIQAESIAIISEYVADKKIVQTVNEALEYLEDPNDPDKTFNELVRRHPTTQRIVLYTPYKSTLVNYFVSVRHLFGSFTIRCDLIRSPSEIRRSFEVQYMLMIRDVLQNGEIIQGRNGETFSVFDARLKFFLGSGFPILTLRTVPFRAVVEELLWILRGEHSSKSLEERKVNVWKHNTSREFLDSRGLTNYEVGEIGPTYGFQMRHAGAQYEAYKLDPAANPGVDQFKYVLDELRRDPTSRRAIINLWSAGEVDRMTLPPCAYSYQFAIRRGHLNCIMSQRSWDIVLGWNPTTAALLTHIYAKLLGVAPGFVVCNIGDVHIYKKFVDDIKYVMCTRATYAPPVLTIAPDLPEDPAQMKVEHFHLNNYNAHPRIAFEIQ